MILFSPLVDHREKPPMNIEGAYGHVEDDESLMYAKQCFMNYPETWPTKEQMGLDQSQYNALMLAFHSDLTLIQGYVI